MDYRLLLVAFLLCGALLLSVQAIFARQIGVAWARRVEHYPPLLRWFYEMFPPDSEFARYCAIVMGVVGTVICLRLALTIFLYMKPITH
jgi:hypothetical protein